ncbi:MAG: hypothetical protein ACTHJ6_03885, partial [Oryzihumus sp.]
MREPHLGHLVETAVSLRRAARVTEALTDAGWRTFGVTTAEKPRPVRVLEIAIDAMDTAAIRPFWRAVLGYPAPGEGTGPTDDLLDP